MYTVDRILNGERMRLGTFGDIQEASRVIDADAQVNGPDVVYYVEREGKKE